MNLNNRVFVSEDFITDATFHYTQSEDIVTATIQGRNIMYGELVGLVNQDGIIHFIFNYLGYDSQFYSGKCHLHTKKERNNKYRLYGLCEVSGTETEKEISLQEI